MKCKRIKLLIILSILTLLYAMYYWLLPFIINFAIKSDFVNNIIPENIKIVNPKVKMGLRPSIWIKSDYVTIKDDSNVTVLNLSAPSLKIKLIPLIIKHIDINNFYADELYAVIKLKKDEKLYLGNYILNEQKDVKINLNRANIEIADYNLFLTDEIKNEKIYLDGDYFELSKFIKAKHFALTTAVKIRANQKSHSMICVNADFKLPLKKMISSDTKIDISASNINLEYFSNYIKVLSKGKITSAKGIINLEIKSNKTSSKNLSDLNLLVKNLAIISPLFKIPYVYNDNFTIKSKSELKKNELNISDFEFKTPKTFANIKGNIKNLNSKSPILNLSIKAKSSDANDIATFLPANNDFFESTTLNIVEVKKAILHGLVNISLNVKGKLPKPEVYGVAKITQAYINKYVYSNVDKASINLFFNKEIFQIDVTVPAPNKQAVWVKGSSQLYDKKIVDLYITSTPSVDLAFAQRLLIPVHKGLDFQLGPVPMMNISGEGNIILNAKGSKKDPHCEGEFKFKNAKALLKDIPDLILENTSGSLKFLDTNTIFETENAYLDKNPISINGTCTLDGKLDFKALAPNQNIAKLIQIVNNSPMLEPISEFTKECKTGTGKASLELNLQGDVKDINEITIGKNLFAQGKINLHKTTIFFKKIKAPLPNLNGEINFKNFDLSVNLSSIIRNSKILLNGTIVDDRANINIDIPKFYPTDLTKSFLPNRISIISANNKTYGTFSGNYKGSVKKFEPKNLNLQGDVFMNNFEFLYKPLGMPIKINNGSININTNEFKINKINANMSKMPLSLDGKIKYIFSKNPKVDVYVFAKPNQEFLDKVFNAKQIYPIKIRGEVIFKSNLTGTSETLFQKSVLHIKPASSIYYMGASIGDEQNPINITMNSEVHKNSFVVKSFSCNKLVKTITGQIASIKQLSTTGDITYNKNNTIFDDFRIKTEIPTDIRIFNIIFKKPFIKQGKFISNLVVNGTAKKPSLRGYIKVYEIDIPFLGTNVNNLLLDFQPREIIIKSKGDVISNSYLLNANVLNKLTPPYVINNLDLNIATLNFNQIVDFLQNNEINSVKYSLDDTDKNKNSDFNISALTIKRANIHADKVLVKNISAEHLDSTFSFNNNLFSLDDFKFKIAQGNVFGDLKYNIKSKLFNLDLNVQETNANMMSDAIFGLQNQIHGNLSGSMNLSCNGTNHKMCMNTLSGNAGFNVNHGNMPKLGSLEYLLKAGNLLKSGITGVSINNILEMLIPLKTGEFDSIKGTINIHNGVADNVQIYSTGKNLSIFITGNYNLNSMIADMYVFGKLSKNISNIFGPIGNASINTLFSKIPGIELSTSSNSIIEGINKIPGLELSSKIYRLFAVEIYGNINGDNYVKSFKWVE